MPWSKCLLKSGCQQCFIQVWLHPCMKRSLLTILSILYGQNLVQVLFFLIVYSISKICHITEVKLSYQCMYYVEFEVKNREVININFVGMPSSSEGLGRFRISQTETFFLEFIVLLSLLCLMTTNVLFFCHQEHGPLAALLAYVSRTI